MRITPFAVACVLLGGLPMTGRADFVGETEVYYTTEMAKSALFKDSEKVVEIRTRITPDVKSEVERRTHDEMTASEITVFKGERDGHDTGYAIILEEVGKFRPITFMVRVDPNAKVANAVVMVYRESRGSEIRSKRFIRQFKGKKSNHAIRINRDIVNITGATLSVVAMTKVVRRALVLIEEAILKKDDEPS